MNNWRSVCLVILFVAFCPAVIVGQGTGGIPGGGDTGGDPTGGGQQIGQPTVGPQGGAERQGLNQTPFDIGGLLESFNPQPEEIRFENSRNQPFIGPSRERFTEQEFIPLRSEATSIGSAGSSVRQLGGGGGRGAGGQSASQGFEISRSQFGLRTRLNPQFVVRNRSTPRQVSSRFERRLSRIPEVAGLANTVNMTVQGTTAILTGSVATEDERQKIVRLTRLEPGIYRIDNRIALSNQ